MWEAEPSHHPNLQTLNNINPLAPDLTEKDDEKIMPEFTLVNPKGI